ncbi:MAG TPA: hypothetical protein VE981_07540 [Planctomycetota bacterium]|nr:hypothetical protein [Planctomycetota bacterium]
MALKRSGVALPTDGFSGIFPWIFWMGLLAAGGYGVFWVIGTIKTRADSEVDTNAPKAMAQWKKETQGVGSVSRNNPSVAYAPRQVTPELDRAAAEVNLNILMKEASRMKGDSVSQMEYARALTGARNRLAAAAAKDRNVPETLQGNDEILGLDDWDFTKMKPDAAAAKITSAASRIPAGTFMRVRVYRDTNRDVILYFASATGTGVVLAHPGFVKISNEFALEIQKQVLAQPPEQLTEFERRQIEGILGRGEASDEEYAMLVNKLTGATTAVKGPAESFARQIQVLKGLLPKAPVPEAIVMKDGRRFTGKLLAETPAAVSVRTVVGDITVAKDDVQTIITADDLRAEFQSKFGAGDKFTDALAQLLTWTREMDMPVHRELVAYTILMRNPIEPYARSAAGYIQMDGIWTLKSSIASGAPIPERKAETKEDIKRELESMGFVLRDGKWFSKVAWSVGMDSLMKGSALKIAYNGTQIFDWHEADTPIYRRDDKPKKLGPLDLKFIAPVQVTGSATILVEAPGELLECHVRATGTIIEDKSGGRIECFLTPQDGKSEVLYDIQSKADFGFHDVSNYVRGKKKFTVTARMVTVKDQFHTYARFLPSNKDTVEAFLVKGVVLKPASEFDRAYNDAR